MRGSFPGGRDVLGGVAEWKVLQDRACLFHVSWNPNENSERVRDAEGDKEER